MKVVVVVEVVVVVVVEKVEVVVVKILLKVSAQWPDEMVSLAHCKININVITSHLHGLYRLLHTCHTPIPLFSKA